MPQGLVQFKKDIVSKSRGAFTSNIVSDTGPEAASPGYEDPLKDLPIYTTRFHDNDWTRVKENA